jgi:hypothetical protein
LRWAAKGHESATNARRPMSIVTILIIVLLVLLVLGFLGRGRFSR